MNKYMEEIVRKIKANPKTCGRCGKKESYPDDIFLKYNTPDGEMWLCDDCMLEVFVFEDDPEWTNRKDCGID